MRRLKPSSGICLGTIFLGHTSDSDYYVAIAPKIKVNTTALSHFRQTRLGYTCMYACYSMVVFIFL